jgi:EmrB/QacA subfamily drug resistance transporter
VTSTTTSPPPVLVSDRRLNVVALVLLLGMITTFLDTTIVTIAIDHLTTAFHATVAQVQWVSTAYLLAFVSVIPASGWAAERFGARRMWLIAIAVFLAASALCGLAWDLPALVVFRIVQGLGGGMVVPLSMTILTRAAGRERLQGAMVVVGFIGQLAPILGPVIGGAILTGLDWRWLFYVNVPICAAALVLGPLLLPANPGHAGHRFDVVGFLLATPGVALVAYGVSAAGGDGGFARLDAWAPLAAGALLLAGFVAHALRTSRAPLIDVRVFRRRAFGMSALITFVAGFSLFAITFLLPLYYQGIRGESVLTTGLLLIPQGVGTMAFLLLYRRFLVKADGRWVIGGGIVVAMLGVLPFTFVGAAGGDVLLLAGQFLQGLGLAAATVPVMAMALASLDHTETARGSAAFNLMQRIGAPFGVTVIAVVLTSLLGGHPTPAVAIGAFHTTFWWVLGLAAIPLVLALFVGRPTPAEAPAASETTAASDEPAAARG